MEKPENPPRFLAETFGEFVRDNVGYYLATAFDHIYLQPSGDVGLTGLATEQPFIKGTLDLLGIGVQMDHRHEYKNAMNLFTETGFTDAHREASEAFVESMTEQMVLGIAQARRTTPEAVRDIIDRGPFLALSAQTEGLVDRLAYWDEVRDLVKNEYGIDAEWLDMGDYLKRIDEKPFSEGPKVALIYGVRTRASRQERLRSLERIGNHGCEYLDQCFSVGGKRQGCACNSVSNRFSRWVLRGFRCNLGAKLSEPGKRTSP